LIGTKIWDDREYDDGVLKLAVIWWLLAPLYLCWWWIVNTQLLDDDRSLPLFYNK